MSHTVPKRYYFTVVLLMTLCAVGTLSAGIYFWLQPILLVLGFALFAIAPVAFHAATGSLFLDPTKTKKALVGQSAPKFVERFRLAVAPVLIVGGVALAFVSTWHLPTTRKLGVSLAKTTRLELSLQRALWDDDYSVVLDACQALENIGAAATPGRLFQLTSDESDAAFDCILQSFVRDASHVDMCRALKAVFH